YLGLFPPRLPAEQPTSTSPRETRSRTSVPWKAIGYIDANTLAQGSQVGTYRKIDIALFTVQPGTAPYTKWGHPPRLSSRGTTKLDPPPQSSPHTSTSDPLTLLRR